MIGDFYNTTALVEQPTRPTTGMGGPKKTYSTRIASLLCRIGKGRATETDQYGKLTIREVWRLYCDASSTNKAIEEKDRITAESKVFQVVGITNPAFKDHHLQIDLEEVR
jgi:hypothetical protein